MRRGGVATAFLLACALPAAAGARHDLHGVGLGMTVDAILVAAHMPCHKNWSGDVHCKDPADGSRYKAMMSGGQPQVALTVSHKFCSSAGEAAVLRQTLADLSVPAGEDRPDPNGYHFNLPPSGEGILDASMGTCAAGGKQYEVSLRGDQLLGGANGAKIP